MRWLEEFILKIKRNKGLWFTILSTLSVLGIFISLFFVSYLVEDVAKKTYERQYNHYTINIKNNISQEKKFVLSLSTIAQKNRLVIDRFAANDENSTSDISNISNNLTRSINSSLERDDIVINFFTSKNSDKAQIINGIIVDSTGTYFQANMPFAENNTTFLNISVKESINVLNRIYNNENKDLVYLINNSSINKIDHKVIKKLYSTVNNEYMVQNNLYNENISKAILTIDYSEIKDKGYTKNKDYFFIGEKTFDVEGKEIGLLLLAEKIDDDSLVKIVKSLVNNVTMVALGLIVSLILFLF